MEDTRMHHSLEVGLTCIERAWSTNPDNCTKAEVALPRPWYLALTGDKEKLNFSCLSCQRKYIHSQGAALMKQINILSLSVF